MSESITVEEKDSESTLQEKSKRTTPKQWYSSVWFWIIFGAVILIGVGLIWYFGFYAPNRSTELQKSATEQSIDDDWISIVQEAEKFTKIVTHANTIDNFSALAANASELSNALEKAQKNYSDQTIVQNDTYSTTLDALTNYVESITEVLNKNKDEIKDTDFANIKTESASAKSSVKTLIANTKYLSKNIVSDFFDLSVPLKTIDDSYVAQVKKAQDDLAQQQAAEAAKQKQLAADQKAAEASATGFTNARMTDTDPYKKLKSFMTQSFKDEYDFATHDSSYALVSYRIIDSVRNSDTRYYIYGRMTEKAIAGTDQFSYDYNLTVIKVGDAWLVDLDQAPAR